MSEAHTYTINTNKSYIRTHKYTELKICPAPMSLYTRTHTLSRTQNVYLYTPRAQGSRDKRIPSIYLTGHSLLDGGSGPQKRVGTYHVPETRAFPWNADNTIRRWESHQRMGACRLATGFRKQEPLSGKCLGSTKHSITETGL